MTQAYEERFLFLLLLLRQPRLRMIYVTSMPIDPRIVEYYLALLPGVIPSHALARLTLLSVGDASIRPLSAKLLERPQLLARIADRIPNRERSHLIPYNTTELERDIAVTLGIPMYGADPRLAPLGTKTGCRRLFGEVGVPYPLGAEDLHSLEDVGSGDRRHARDPPVDGPGDRQAQRRRVRHRQRARRTRRSHRAVAAASVAARSSSASGRCSSSRPTSGSMPYVAKLGSDGGIVEERIVGEDLLSPSVQLRARPDGRVELLSTHDQLLGGASGQSYLGCTFPADPAYSRLISEPAMAIGERLAREGRDRPVRGRLRRREGCRGRLVGVRDRAEPPQRGHDASVPHAAVPDRREL